MNSPNQYPTPTVPAYGAKRTVTVVGPKSTVPVVGPQTESPVSGPTNTVPLVNASPRPPNHGTSGWQTPPAALHPSVWSTPNPSVSPSEWATEHPAVHSSVWATPNAGVAPQAWQATPTGLHSSAWSTPRAEIHEAPGFPSDPDAPHSTDLINQMMGFARDPQAYTQGVVRQRAGGEPLSLLDHILGFASRPFGV